MQFPEGLENTPFKVCMEVQVINEFIEPKQFWGQAFGVICPWDWHEKAGDFKYLLSMGCK